MLNQVILVGEIVEQPTLTKTANGISNSNIVLAVRRVYKNSDTGDYDVDKIPVTLWRGLAENTVMYCRKGSTIGISAKLKTDSNGKLIVVAEKITFINTKEEEE